MSKVVKLDEVKKTKAKKKVATKSKKLTAKQKALQDYQTGNMSIIDLHRFNPTAWEMYKEK